LLLSLLLLLLMSVLLRTLPEQPPRSEDVVEIDINVYHVGNRRLVSAANVLGCAGRKKTTWSGRDCSPGQSEWVGAREKTPMITF